MNFNCRLIYFLSLDSYLNNFLKVCVVFLFDIFFVVGFVLVLFFGGKVIGLFIVVGFLLILFLFKIMFILFLCELLWCLVVFVGFYFGYCFYIYFFFIGFVFNEKCLVNLDFEFYGLVIVFLVVGIFCGFLIFKFFYYFYKVMLLVLFGFFVVFVVLFLVIFLEGC